MALHGADEAVMMDDGAGKIPDGGVRLFNLDAATSFWGDVFVLQGALEAVSAML